MIGGVKGVARGSRSFSSDLERVEGGGSMLGLVRAIQPEERTQLKGRWGIRLLHGDDAHASRVSVSLI
jgi:hypothetical protein